MLTLLVVLVISITPFASPNPVNSNGSVSIALNDFKALKRLGSGKYGSVYLVKKNGATDGKLYALKAVNIPRTLEYEEKFRQNDRTSDLDLLNNERKVLEAVRGTSWATGLQYAFVKGSWSFLVIDLGCGGTVESRMHMDKPDDITIKSILAELVTAIEMLHSKNILHIDLDLENVVVSHTGHILLTDFGRAQRLTCNKASEWDWRYLSDMCREIFHNPHRNCNEIGLIGKLKNMTDADLPELKNHPYFEGIDWESVAERKSNPPFEPMEIHVNDENPLNLIEMLGKELDEELDTTISKRLQDYQFIAPEHQN